MQSKMNLRKQQFEAGKQGQTTFQQSSGGHIIRLNGKRYQYNGTGDTADIRNYTEIK